MKKILCLVFSIILVASVMVSCGGPDVTSTVNLKFIAGNDEVFNSEVIIDGANPTVIDVVNEAIMMYGLRATLDSQNTSVEKASYYYRTEIDGLTYYWEYTINGVLPETGRANTNTVVTGDTIEYTFMIYDPATESYVNDNSLIEFFTLDEEELADLAESEAAESESLAAAETETEEESIDLSDFLEEDELSEDEE